ncbi:hypothetical protein SAMN05216316_1825 [Nitrosovibrio sp. Nv6]|nr:hypothetical protein SAMN05216316_1825 [Nitrosovibrio sp. Nv6]
MARRAGNITLLIHFLILRAFLLHESAMENPVPSVYPGGRGSQAYDLPLLTL